MPQGGQGSGEPPRGSNPRSEQGEHSRPHGVTAAEPASVEANSRALNAFVLELGQMLSLAGTAVSETQDRLMKIATANGAGEARIVVLPTTLIVGVGPTRRATVEVIPQLTGALRLDQIAALYEIVKRAEAGTVSPREGLARLQAIPNMRPRHGRTVSVLAHALMTVGLCLLLKPNPSDIAACAGFGVLVGLLAALSRGRHALSVLSPVIAAVLVSTMTFVLIKHGTADLGLPVLIAPLVTFLPGAALTTATVELASGDMVAGSSRVVFGGLQLLLLAFGIIAGAELAGLPRVGVLIDSQRDALGWWAPWLGVVVFGIAASLYFSAPRGATRWLLLVLLVAWVGQFIGDRLVGAGASGFCGALAMAPVALGVARIPTGPPSQVTFLPAFWMLVPGALGLISVTEIFGSAATITSHDLVQPIASIVAIALGVLCGVSIYQAVAASPSRIKAWQKAVATTARRHPIKRHR